MLGPAPFSSIDRYARRYGIEGLEAFQRFQTIIRALDAEYLAQMAAKAAQKPPPDDDEDDAAAKAREASKRAMLKRSRQG
jgi:hypothetical protein